MALPLSSSSPDTGTIANANDDAQLLAAEASPDTRKLTDYLNKLDHRNSLAGAGIPRLIRDGTAAGKGGGGKGASTRDLLAATGAGADGDEGQLCRHAMGSARLGYVVAEEEEDRGLRESMAQTGADNKASFVAQGPSGESDDAGPDLAASSFSSDDQSRSRLGFEPISPGHRLSSSGSSLSLSSSSSSSPSSPVSARHGPPPGSRTEPSTLSPRVSLARQLAEITSQQDGRRQNNHSPSRQSEVGWRNGNGTFGSGRAAALAWEELNLTQDMLRDRMDDLREMVASLNKKVKEAEVESKQRAKMQVAKDTAQDEILDMELKQLERQIAARLSRCELLDMTAKQNQKFKSMETAVLGLIDERAESLHHKLHGELEKVLKQLYTIQQAGEKGRNVVEERVRQCVTEQAGLQKELQKERREKEELHSRCKRLAERLLQVETRQAETALRQEAGLKSLEKQCNQCLVAEATNRQNDMMGMATALRDDLAENMEAVRKERVALQTELVAHCEIKAAHCRQDAVQAIANSNAVQMQNLAALETNLRRDMTAQLESTLKDLLARFQALADAQQAAEAQALALCTRQAARTEDVQAEMAATLHHTMQALVEQLESKTAALQHELRDQHMHLSQRLSVAVQRLALCEVKSGERHDLLKSALTEMALKLIKEDAIDALGPSPSIPDLLAELGVQRTETAHVLVRLEEEAATVLASCKQVQGSVQALATRDNHWQVLDARLHEHYQNLVSHCLVVIVRPSSSSSSSGAEQLLQLQGRALLLKKETQDVIATHSYRIAKTIALKADYDVIRSSVERKDALTDEECDASILQSRETYLRRFLDAVATGVDKAIAVEGTGVGVKESLAQFHLKLEQAIRLALSKFSRIHVGRSLLGRIGLETQAACLSCDRPLCEESGSGSRASSKKPVTASTATTAIASVTGTSAPRRTSLYRANPSGFKTFSFVKEVSFLENALKEQRARQPDSRGAPTPSTNTPLARPSRRQTSYAWGPATG